MSFPVVVERRTDMGWMSKLHLRLEDGQPLVAQLPNEEIEGVSADQHLFANLRNPKVFARDQADLATVGESDPIAIADAAGGDAAAG